MIIGRSYETKGAKKMKRLSSRIVIVLAVLLSFMTLCFAEFQPDPSRWVWINSNETTGLWFDKRTVSVKQNYGRYQVRLWTLQYENSPDEYYAKILYNVDINNRQIYIMEGLKYDMQGNLIDSVYANQIKDNPVNVVPDTNSELIYSIATIYIPHKA
ncbi:hypothetical protein LK430_08905 [Acidaminococcus fermentans DSM 20731]|uniref:Uncharacterized protein n=1 Tax=Acidaminococcus fermentans (strain ATCC 25085 / DSM 20731 / CCUG 9996 / CIP 106432 / VR4) TaxID=591001 RepID=D2RK26_ACIFV|nr:hypothetical protein [Acidaminococcus fermentans]ADB47428.1 hypothetical protein Acfer_1059 [Acidaminococcus fermentans DSM 20731]UEA71958.1 hypothetical protein LK430_08905 [Acidaminococcus fermentans DSM 20731]